MRFQSIHCEKEIKCSTSLTFYLFSPTRLINSIKHEHSCKIFYFFNVLIESISDFILFSKEFVYDIVRGDQDSRANLMPIYGDLYQIKL